MRYVEDHRRQTHSRIVGPCFQAGEDDRHPRRSASRRGSPTGTQNRDGRHCDHGWIDRAVACCRRREAFRRYSRCRTDECRRPDSQAAAQNSKGDELRQTKIWEVIITAGKWLRTACNLCYINCGIEVWVNDGRLGPRINLLTESGNRDPIAGTPYHKNVAVRLALVTEHEAAACQSQSERIYKRAAGQ